MSYTFQKASGGLRRLPGAHVVTRHLPHGQAAGAPALAQAVSQGMSAAKPGILAAANRIDALPVLLAVVDAQWRMVAANERWMEAVKRHAYDHRLAAGASYRDFCEWRRASGSKEAAAVLAGIRGIEDGDLRHFSYRSAIDGRLAELSIMPFEIGGQGYATISYLDGLAADTVQHEKLLLAEEHERQRLTRELHDGASQYLTGLNLALAQLRQVNRNPKVTAIADDLSAILEDFHRDLKALTYVRHPPDLERFGLIAAIRMLCAGYAKRAGIRLSLQLHGGDPVTGPVPAAAYRIAQEALANAYRHARARHIRVRLNSGLDALTLVIEDDGVGLKADARILLEQGAVGVGIPGMIARVAEFGGRMVIRSRRHQTGTILGVLLPHLSGRRAPSDKVIPLKRLAGAVQPALSYASSCAASEAADQACTMLLRTA